MQVNYMHDTIESCTPHYERHLKDVNKRTRETWLPLRTFKIRQGQPSMSLDASSFRNVCTQVWVVSAELLAKIHDANRSRSSIDH